MARNVMGVRSGSLTEGDGKNTFRVLRVVSVEVVGLGFARYAL